MKKKEALDYIKLKKGYVPYIDIFKIYNENDVIPKELIDLSAKKNKQKCMVLTLSPEFAELFKKKLKASN